MGLILTIFGVMVGLLGVSVAAFQTLRYNQLNVVLKQLRRATNADTWTDIGLVVRTFDSLDEARDLIASREPVDDEVISKISSARRGTVDHWRELLKDAVLQEPEFNSATLEKWIEMGRLENEWRIAQARRLLTVQAENNRRDASHDQ